MRTGSTSISIDSPDLAQFGADLGNSARVFLEEFERGMNEALAVLEEQIAGRVPVNSGFLRSSIGTNLYGEDMAIRGEVVSIASYGAAVEYGRKPGKMPPVAAIELWVRRKLGINNDKEARSVAYVIARAIGRRGTVGAHMFQLGMSAAAPYIEKIFDAAVDRAVRRLAK